MANPRHRGARIGFDLVVGAACDGRTGGTQNHGIADTGVRRFDFLSQLPNGTDEEHEAIQCKTTEFSVRL